MKCEWIGFTLFWVLKNQYYASTGAWSTRLWAISQGSNVGVFMELWLKMEGNMSIL